MARIVAPEGGVNQDIAIVVDTTGSMGDEISAVIESATEIVNTILAGTGSRVSIIGYNDPDVDVLQTFTSDAGLVTSAIGMLGASGGGDFPEFVNSGLIAALDGSAGLWRASAEASRIILFGDAPDKDTDLFDDMVALSNNAASDGGTVDVEIYPVLIGDSFGNFDPDASAAFSDIASATGGALIEAESVDEVVDSILSIVLTTLEPVTGTASSDEIIGGRGFDKIFAGEGADTITAGDGSDVVFGGGGDDVAFGGNGNDSMFGGTGNDLIVTGNGSDEVYGGEGGDELGGGEGDDMMGGGTGSDAAYGSSGADTMFGGGDGSADAVYGGEDEDLIFGGGGADTMAGGAGADEMGGGGGNDAMASGEDNDLCYGGAGNDTIYTGDGQDTVYGGSGNDQIYLGSDDFASDLLVADEVNGNDTVYGFETFYDEVDLSATNLTSFTDVEAALSTNASGDAVLTFDGGSIVFYGVSESDLSSFNFTF